MLVILQVRYRILLTLIFVSQMIPLKGSGQLYFPIPLRGKIFLLFAQNVIKTSSLNFKNRNPTSRRAHRPSACPVSNNCRHLHFNPINARRIQTLYRVSKKGAARKVFEDSSPTYSGSVEDANSFFSKVFDSKDCNIEAIKDRLQDFVPKGPNDYGLLLQPSPEEIPQKLCSLSNSSPGVDRVEYRHSKSVDPKCNILALIFARCMTQCDVPESWKSLTTILIHKKGSSDDVSNFRPIALMSCIYKLLMSVIANRLVSFSINNDILSPSQKSAGPSEGCCEHTFILQSLVSDAQRIKNLFLAWLDLHNTFSSVPHDVISTTLSHIGIPASLVQLMRNVYTNASTQIRTSDGITPPIPILAGVKQGCPLSPILFNLSIEVILRSINTKAQSF